MTHQFNSEQDLFDSEAKSEVKPSHSRKRSSFGPRLPIRPSSQSSSDKEMADQPGETSQAGGNGGGNGASVKKPTAKQQSVIGVPGFQVKEQGKNVVSGKDSQGKLVEFNAFDDVFAGAFPNSSMLERFLNYVEHSGSHNFESFIAGISYQGFDREVYIRAALKRVSVSVFCRFAILGAVRGSNFKKIVDSCLEMPVDLIQLVDNGVILKKAKKREDLTILRFTASIPHWVAFWLFKVDFPKKIESSDCPGWLQFPGAASLPMSKDIRLKHIAFCKAFSSLLPGGEFNGNIYYTAYSNQIPEKDVPKMLKEQLGVGADPQGTISSDDVRAQVSMELVKKK